MAYQFCQSTTRRLASVAVASETGSGLIAEVQLDDSFSLEPGVARPKTAISQADSQDMLLVGLSGG
ncbi:hypothetical protein CMK12_16675 [Candidatus Poribacteria bacterium]|nr:hypothetical protein [Candidatus Poribacteria bacterium]